MSLMAQVDRARSTLQAANEQLSEARELLGLSKQEAPKEKGLFDRVKDAVSNVSLSDVGHTVLDVAGFVPGLGTVADLAHAAWYLAEGDKTNAALAAASAIPFAGDAFAAAKLGNKAVDAVRTADNAIDAAETFRLADNVEESMVRADKIRQELGSGKKRNIAFADVNIGGRSDTLKADSGPTPRQGGIGLPEKPIFETFETPPGHKRNLDTEYKILEEIATRYADNPEVKGTVNLFTEIYPCPCCAGVIKQFERKFPNITLDVTHGGRS